MRRKKKNRSVFKIFSFFIVFIMVLGVFYLFNYANKNEMQANESSQETSKAVSESGSEEQSSANQDTAAESAESEDTLSALPDVHTSDWNLKLVNRTNPLEQNVDIEFYTASNGMVMDKRTEEAYLALMQAAEAAGMDLTLISAYRSIEAQENVYNSVYNNYISQGNDPATATELTEKLISLPYSSEHSLGLAVDITATALVDQGENGLLEKLETYPEGIWLRENAPNYGYILRYPRGREDSTMIEYEPWHFRYVGVENAKYITEHNLTLEEYLELLKENE